MLNFMPNLRMGGWFATLALMFVYGCSGNEPLEHAECVQGEERQLACGLYGTGFQTQSCGPNFRWGVPGECRIELACTHQELRSEPCGGLNGNATRSQRCELGVWPEAWGACMDPDLCKNGDTTEHLCTGEDAGIAGRATQAKTCVDGKWEGDGPCIDRDLCAPAAPEAHCGPDAICVPNGEDGAYVCACPDGWLENGQNDQGLICEELNECEDDALNECGANATCENTDGSYICHCNLGFFDRDGDGFHCEVTASVSSGHQSTCAISTAGNLYCWGDNRDGQAGFVPRKSQEERLLTPHRVDGEQRWSLVSTGESHSCGVTNQQELYCWGRNDFGQLGIGSESVPQAPTKVAPPAPAKGWKQVSVGKYHSCAIAESGLLYCWGRNEFGEVGFGSVMNMNVPRLVNSWAWGTIHAGAEHTCGVRSLRLYCWGRNRERQIEDSATANFTAPRITQNVDVLFAASRGNSVAFGDYMSFHYRGALASSGLVSIAPTVDFVLSFLEPGVEHICGRSTQGEIRCWLGNSRGQVGSGTVDPNVVSQADAKAVVWGGKNWKILSVGGWHSCALHNDNSLYCWGDNTFGQLGDGMSTQRNLPTLIRPQ